MLKATDELLDLMKLKEPKGILTSLDVQSLYTNVPIDQTIEIILETVYNTECKPPPQLPKQTLKQLLQICTKEASFKHMDGENKSANRRNCNGKPFGVHLC